MSKSDLTSGQDLAYWHRRYTIRNRTSADLAIPGSRDPTSQQQQQSFGSPFTGAGAGGGGGAGTQQQQQQQQLDVPVFLQGHADMVLTTGRCTADAV